MAEQALSSTSTVINDLEMATCKACRCAAIRAFVDESFVNTTFTPSHATTSFFLGMQARHLPNVQTVSYPIPASPTSGCRRVFSFNLGEHQLTYCSIPPTKARV
eukprot:6209882-Pleurochrysis_carterae.AAC.2